jgi:glycosyltransferase involved in cell wall biosynthesis
LSTAAEPRVTVLTPVYNGGEFLRECIESVLAQEYSNWEYVIVNNCSTDDSLQIAQEYAAADPRIRVTTNTRFMSMPENFNNAFSMVPATSDYFKVVCADDWIDPAFLRKTVACGEENPTAGIVCTYQQSGARVRWAELPASTTFLKGVEAARLALLEGAEILPAPTAVLFRRSTLQAGKPFYPNDYPHSDTSAIYEFLHQSDYAIVHEVLSAERVHEGQISSKIERVHAGDAAYVEVFLTYGQRFLAPTEFAARRLEVFDDYYRNLGRALLHMSGREFWQFHQARLQDLGLALDKPRIARAAIGVALSKARSPRYAARKARDVLRDRLRT